MRWLRTFAIFALPGLFQGAPCQALTMDEAVRIAVENAFDVRSARADVARAMAVIREAKAATIPKLTFNATYTRFTKENTAVFDPSEPPVVIRPIDRASLELRVAQLVDISGASSAGLSAVWALLYASQAVVAGAINEAAERAKTAFVDVLRTEELEDVARERVSNAEAFLAQANARVAAGTAPRFDAIRFDAELSNAQTGLLQASNDVEVAKAALNHAMSRDPGTPVEVVRPSAIPTLTKGPNELAAFGRENRPEVIAAARRLDYQSRVRQVQEKANFPSLNISASAIRDPNADTGFSGERDTISATAMLSFPIYDGGVVRAKVAQAREDERKARIALEQAQLRVDLEVRQAYLNAQTAKRVIESAEKNVALAREALRLAQVRYEAGVGTTVEVSDANVQFVEARTNWVNAQYAYLDAIARLQRAAGLEEL